LPGGQAHPDGSDRAHAKHCAPSHTTCLRTCLVLIPCGQPSGHDNYLGTPTSAHPQQMGTIRLSSPTRRTLKKRWDW
jgi:hypothetical protein